MSLCEFIKLDLFIPLDLSKEYKVTIKEGASGHETYYYRADCRPYCNYRDDGFLVSQFGTLGTFGTEERGTSLWDVL